MKEELEKELAKHGVSYVYARTKDAADVLAKKGWNLSSASHGDAGGGYIFFETSLLAAPVLRVEDIGVRDGQNAYIESAIQMSTGAEGKCVSFR
ncbi:unnamed protein product [Bemisia tabaci]|uniref:Uncharacterized protein n=1 Tax=Bemisia tabaci TaxID=7038 RepID=A0A9N9ZYU0_BEMTA|nr:unnamed protein product [Bemisia tabaci]